MYHTRFTGTHYDAGKNYGTRLYNNGILMQDQHIMQVSKEKLEFGKNCVQVTKNYYPEILDEIQGFSDGQKINFEEYAAFIFGIYCFELTNFCTCFAFSNPDNILFGRNSDFLTKLEKVYDSSFYNLKNAYSFIGNTTAMVQMEDGVNEHGLAIGLTFIVPKLIKPGLNAGLLLRYLLEKCKTVDESIEKLKLLPISSSQTLTMIDKDGNMAVVESNCETIKVISPKHNYVAAANLFNSNEMQKYQPKDIDDWHAKERFETADQALKSNSDSFSLDLAKDILSGKHGFICQYDRSSGHDTVWSSIYDLKNKKIYRVEGNPAQKKYIEDTRLKFSY